MSNSIPFPKKPLPPLALIEEEHVTLPRLKQVLDSAFIDSEIDTEGDLFVSQGLDFPIWVALEPDRKALNIYTCVGIRISDARAFSAVNELNQGLILAQFHVKDRALWANHWMSIDNGLLARQFVLTLRRFATIFQEAMDHPCAKELFADPSA
ncbi:MAG: hypothetical protein EKK41_26465 [Hyphomicrobiales bacterium]|nr:MAG: hypothetical protein EKK41_26465 [Hyphomicrobiales bacterium]